MHTLEAVQGFLTNLDPSVDAKFAIETYPDQSKAGTTNTHNLKRRWMDLSVEDVIKLTPDLEDLNKNHAAIYVAVNEFDGYRAKNNLRHLRCIHADMDYTTNQKLEELKAICPPSIIVESSPGRFHFYWFLEERLEPNLMAEIESLNKAMVNFGADKAATDCSRLLRLPGFLNQKHRDSKHYVRATSNTGLRYSIQSIKQKLGFDKSVAMTNQSNLESAPMPVENALIERISTMVAAAEPSLMEGAWEKQSNDPDWMIGYESQSDADLALAGKIARIATTEGISLDALPMVVEGVFNLSGLAKREKWQSRPDYRLRTIKKALSNIETDVSAANRVFAEPDVKKMHGDVLNGHKFAEYWRGRMIYVTTLNKWLKWTGA